jgi:hypothetical protein
MATTKHFFGGGDPDWIRTSDPQLRRPTATIDLVAVFQLLSCPCRELLLGGSHCSFDLRHIGAVGFDVFE